MRRRLRWPLRTMLAQVTGLACRLGHVVPWMQQRRAFLAQPDAQCSARP